MLKVTAVFLVLLVGLCFSGSPHNIVVDGDLSDWSEDELIIYDGEGDSWWGQANEIEKVYLTWDNVALYVGAGFSLYYNAFLIVFDLGLRRGVTDLKRLNWYPRDLVFQGFVADAILALWNGELSTGGFRTIENNGQTSPAQASIVVQGDGTGRFAIEAKLPWSSLYQSSTIVDIGAAIKLIAAICGGDNSSAGDIAPNQPPGSIRINTYYSVPVDADKNGYPDSVVSIVGVGSVTKTKFVPLEISAISVSPDIFNSSKDSELRINFVLSVGAKVDISIFAVDGGLIKNLLVNEILNTGFHSFAWDGRDKNGVLVATGVYILNLVADDAVRVKKPFVVVR